MTFKKITHLIYEMDGLLLDTEPIYTEVTQEIVRRFGKNFDWSLKSQMIGKKAIESAHILVDSLDLPITAEDYLEERKDLLAQKFPLASALPGARELVQHFSRHHYPQAVATSSNQEYYQLKTSRHQDWFCLFDWVVTVDDPEVQQGKPAPDLFLTAAKRLQALPSQCLVFEDAPVGIEAASRAGMSVVAVPDPHMDKAAFGEAQQILNSLREFQPELWGLPPLKIRS